MARAYETVFMFQGHFEQNNNNDFEKLCCVNYLILTGYWVYIHTLLGLLCLSSLSMRNWQFWFLRHTILCNLSFELFPIAFDRDFVMTRDFPSALIDLTTTVVIIFASSVTLFVFRLPLKCIFKIFEFVLFLLSYLFWLSSQTTSNKKS